MKSSNTHNANLTLFLVSMSALLLEVLQMRLFAYSLQFFMVHIAVAVSMLGWGIGAAILSAVFHSEKSHRLRLLTLALAAYFLTIILTNAAFARLSHTLPLDSGKILNTALAFSLMSLPYVFAGFAISLLFIAPQRQIPTLYMINLLGSALGCMAIFPLMPPLGAPVLLGLIALLVAVCLVLIQPHWRGRLTAAVLAGGGAVTAIAAAQSLFPFQPESMDQYQAIKNAIAASNPRAEERLEFQKWDPSGVAEVYAWYEDGRPAIPVNVPHPIDSKLYMQDGGAGSLLYDFGPQLENGGAFFDNTIYGVPYFVSPPGDVLVIGLGGAVDIQAALHYSANRITGVDINRAVIDLVREDFSEFLGNPYGRDGVTVVHSDGRTVAKQADGQYDLIHMTGADTKAIWVSAATILNTNFLYTREAFAEYWRALKPGGDARLSITRFSIDLFRLAATAWETLEAEGIADPGRHMVITFQGMWGNLLVKKTPFSDEQLAAFRAAVERHNANPQDWADVQWLEYLRFTDDLTFNLNYPFEIAWAPDRPSPDNFKAYEEMLAAYREKRAGQFFDATYTSAGQDHRPVTDDRPFFFFRGRVDDILKGGFFLVNIYMRFMGLIAALTLAGIFLPLVFRSITVPRSARSERKPSSLSLYLPSLYFIGLGAGFMLIEVGLMQQLVIFLGNQTRSVSVVLSSLLVWSGIGSFYSGRWELAALPRRILWCGLAILVVLAGLQLILPIVNQSFITWPAAARGGIVMLLLAPLGLTMGVMFPSGLRMMEARSPHFIPWAMGLNSFASVMASVGFIVLALLAGFQGAIIAGGLCYLMAIALSQVIWTMRSGV